MKVVVLGAGTMGAQVAAHAVAQGLEVALLDVASPSGDRNAAAKKGIAALLKLKPSPLHLPEHASALRPGNFEDDLAREVKNADWVLEAVVEDLEIKRRLFSTMSPLLKKTAVLSTNTSGLRIASMAEVLEPDLQTRFLGTHFFNPPRYLHLLETIPGPATSPEVLRVIEGFADRVLGKGVVRAKDTPGFIANRIGTFGLGAALRAMVDLDLSVEAVDALTGPAVGRPKSATLRTADIAGVDVCVKVAAHLFDALPDDPGRATFKLPDFTREMVARGLLGEKAGQGFYKKDKSEILALDWKALEYRPRQKVRLSSLEAVAAISDPAARIRALIAGKDEGAEFCRRVLLETSLYAASVLPEIADDVTSVDRAMEWGYGWSLGPFRLLDALSLSVVTAALEASARPIPSLVAALVAASRPTFYMADGRARTSFGPQGPVPLAERPGVLDLEMRKEEGGAVQKRNAGASLVDIGDGCALVEFHSKLNVLGPDAFAMLQAAAREAADHFDALVIGNRGESFTAGANLMLVLLGAQEEDWDELDASIRQFQNANMALKYAELPVVAAPFGLALGGGCEVCLHADRVRLSAETYMGLVETGVGVIPGGGGTKELALRAHDRCVGVDGADPFPFVKRAFDLIAFARISTSGQEAKRLFLTPADGVSANPDRIIEDAKQDALGMARAGYRPGRPRTDIPVLGRPALATFKMGIYNALRGKNISDHDALVATQVATVLCGGDREPGLASEQHYLDLEREAFLSLLGTKKTQERIQHMLKEGKPLRN